MQVRLQVLISTNDPKVLKKADPENYIRKHIFGTLRRMYHTEQIVNPNLVIEYVSVASDDDALGEDQ
jgi:hypothetical protein